MGSAVGAWLLRDKFGAVVSEFRNVGRIVGSLGIHIVGLRVCSSFDSGDNAINIENVCPKDGCIDGSGDGIGVSSRGGFGDGSSDGSGDGIGDGSGDGIRDGARYSSNGIEDGP
mmetsp:Transcript_13751/g.15766  ORF Transcript_13751/g.15766 Transcript_13751/m.15766 type:complete len:114 (-) Transcript_13751:332-673(-)